MNNPHNLPAYLQTHAHEIQVNRYFLCDDDGEESIIETFQGCGFDRPHSSTLFEFEAVAPKKARMI